MRNASRDRAVLAYPAPQIAALLGLPTPRDPEDGLSVGGLLSPASVRGATFPARPAPTVQGAVEPAFSSCAVARSSPSASVGSSSQRLWRRAAPSGHRMKRAGTHSEHAMAIPVPRTGGTTTPTATSSPASVALRRMHASQRMHPFPVAWESASSRSIGRWPAMVTVCRLSGSRGKHNERGDQDHDDKDHLGGGSTRLIGEITSTRSLRDRHGVENAVFDDPAGARGLLSGLFG